MHSVTLGATTIRECERCLGLWVDVPSFEKICANREQQAALLGAASPAPTKLVQDRQSTLCSLSRMQATDESDQLCALFRRGGGHLQGTRNMVRPRGVEPNCGIHTGRRIRRGTGQRKSGARGRTPQSGTTDRTGDARRLPVSPNRTMNATKDCFRGKPLKNLLG